MESLEDVTDHSHEEDPEYVNNPSNNYRWTPEMNKIVIEGVTNHAKPNVIKRNLKNANVFVGRSVPTKTQLYNKIAATKKTVFPSSSVRNTHELRQKVAEYLDQPASDIEAFIPFHDIDDEDEKKEPRFTIILTSKKNLGKLTNDRVLQTDATYRLNWLGFPVFVVGKKLFITFITLSEQIRFHIFTSQFSNYFWQTSQAYFHDLLIYDARHFLQYLFIFGKPYIYSNRCCLIFGIYAASYSLQFLITFSKHCMTIGWMIHHVVPLSIHYIKYV